MNPNLTAASERSKLIQWLVGFVAECGGDEDALHAVFDAVFVALENTAVLCGGGDGFHGGLTLFL